jgi:NADH:ubiquinone oxidoreductase subunit 3 (subunit A)
MKKIENWRISNQFFSIGMLLISATDLIVLYLASLFFDLQKISVYYYIVLLAIQFIILIYLTEKKISSHEKP